MRCMYLYCVGPSRTLYHISLLLPIAETLSRTTEGTGYVIEIPSWDVAASPSTSQSL
jgi:hypothetical protein